MCVWVSARGVVVVLVEIIFQGRAGKIKAGRIVYFGGLYKNMTGFIYIRGNSTKIWIRFLRRITSTIAPRVLLVPTTKHNLPGGLNTFTI